MGVLAAHSSKVLAEPDLWEVWAIADRHSDVNDIFSAHTRLRHHMKLGIAKWCDEISQNGPSVH